MERDNKSFLRAVVEDVLRIRIKPKPSIISKLPIASPGENIGDILSDLDATTVIDVSQLHNFRTIADDREMQYRIFDEMTLDSIISSAIEMYADDATQYNSKGDVIWAESTDSDTSAFANRVIDVLGLNSNAWSHIYAMVKYGDLYLETFKDDEVNDGDPLVTTNLSYSSDLVINDHKVGAKLEDYIETVNNPAEIFDLTKKGKTVGFVRVPMDNTNNNTMDTTKYNYQYIQKGNNIDILPADKYIHISISNNTERFPMKLTLSFLGEDDKTKGSDSFSTYEYVVKRGKSILLDIYKIYKEISLMEDSLLLNRVTKSSLIRILQIEVGDMPKNQARELLKRVKTIIEQKNFMDKDTGSFSSGASPGPMENIIYVPTHDGKGTITSSNLGGDIDVKSIADLDYFKNKLYAGIKIPKQFLGEDDGGGFSGGTSLTKLDSRYARTVKRIQNAYISGITTLINLFALDRGLEDHVNNFTIKMTSPSTVEDQERDETLSSKMGLIGDFLDIITGLDMIDNKTMKEVVLYFINNYLNEPEIAELINKDDYIDKNPEEGTEKADLSGIGGKPSPFSGPDINIDTGGDTEPGGEEPSQEPETVDVDTNPEAFGDFTSEF